MKRLWVMMLAFCLLASNLIQIQAINTSYKPIGCVDSITAVGNVVKVSGWSFDQDSTTSSIDVKVYIGSTCLGTLKTNSDRPDVNKAYSISGVHGFSQSLETTYSGNQTVVVKAIDLVTNKEYTIGSKTVFITSTSASTGVTTNYNPQGCIDSVASHKANQISIGGWAFDKDKLSASLKVKAYIGNVCVGECITDASRDDVNKAYGITGIHGFSASFDINYTGSQKVEIRVLDLGTNKEYSLGSKTVTISSTSTSTGTTTKYSPLGCIDSVASQSEGKVSIGGWAFDKDDISKSVQIKAYIGSTCIGEVSANVSRPDVNTAYKITGNHGFGHILDTSFSGNQTVEIKAVDLGTNKEYSLGAKTVYIKAKQAATTQTFSTNYNPQGNIDFIESNDPKTISIGGWAFDKDDTTQNLKIRVYINNQSIGEFTTSSTRSDVNTIYKITGTHGISNKLTTTYTGKQKVEVKALDLGTNKEYLIGSKDVTIKEATVTPADPQPTFTTKYQPLGTLDSAGITDNLKVRVGGWAFDKDSPTTSIKIKVYLGTTCIGEATTKDNRPDVNTAYSITGIHGFNDEFDTTLRGTYTLYVKAVDLGTNTEYTVGSKSVTIGTETTPQPPKEQTTLYIPQGVIDSVSCPDSKKVKISGWAFDKDDVEATLEVRAYIGSTRIGTTQANQTRGDVNTAYNITGQHGYSATFDTTFTGVQTVEVRVLDLYTNKEHSLGTKSVNIEGGSNSTTLTKDSAHWIGHRGFSSMAPENTVKSFTLAGQAGFWGCETDIFITADNEFICMHDPNLSRMTGVDALPKNMTLQQIKQLTIISGNNLDLYKNDETAIRVPTLEEYLNVCKQYGMVPVIEIKDDPTVGLSILTMSQMELLYSKVKAIMGNNLVIYIGFDLNNLINMRSVMASHGDISARLQYLTSSPGNVPFTTLTAHMIEVDANVVSITQSVADLYKSKGIRLSAWTCDTVSGANTLISYGVENITSNYKLWS